MAGSGSRREADDVPIVIDSIQYVDLILWPVRPTTDLQPRIATPAHHSRPWPTHMTGRRDVRHVIRWAELGRTKRSARAAIAKPAAGHGHRGTNLPLPRE